MQITVLDEFSGPEVETRNAGLAARGSFVLRPRRFIALEFAQQPRQGTPIVGPDGRVLLQKSKFRDFSYCEPDRGTKSWMRQNPAARVASPVASFIDSHARSLHAPHRLVPVADDGSGNNANSNQGDHQH